MPQRSMTMSDLFQDKAYVNGARIDSDSGATGTRALNIVHEEGLIFCTIGDVLVLCPPLVIAEHELEKIVSRMLRVVGRTHEWVSTKGLERGRNL